MSAFLLALAPWLLAAEGASRPLDQCVPADALAVHFGRPSPAMRSAPPDSAVDRLAGTLITLKALGIIPRQGRVIADIVGTLPTLGRHPHALILLDITSKQLGENSYRLNDLQAALVIDSGGMTKDLRLRIRDLLRSYSDSENGRIDERQAGGVTYYRLTDRRLPPWAIAEWGEVGAHVVVTFGSGAFERMFPVMQGRSASLGDDAWFARTHQRLRGGTSGIEVYADFSRIRIRLGETMKGQPRAVMQQLGLEQVERLLWTTGMDDRALRSEVIAKEVAGDDHYLRLTGKKVASPEVAERIPPEAGSYAVFRFPLTEAVRQARRAYLESQSPDRRLRWRRGWQRLEEEFGFDVESRLIDRLGEHLVFHTFPPHPLGVPLLCTVWIAYEGDRATVAGTIDCMMQAWQRHLSGEEAPAESRPAIGLSPQLKRDPDGIWYLQLGFVGPALAVADGWIVISFAPEAVRENLAYLKSLQAEDP